MKTYTAKPGEIQRDWYVVDAEGKTLGRLATQIADTLRGKQKPQYTPHVDTGDFVIVINAERVAMTGNKAEEPLYRHSQYPGGLKKTTRGALLAKFPERLVERVIKGMLPHNRLGADIYRKLKVYAGPNHPHEAQKPKVHEF